MDGMKRLGICFMLAALVRAESADEKDARATVEKLFAGMAAHDEGAIRSVSLPDARLYSVRDTGEPATATLDDFAKRIAGMKGDLLERFTSAPRVLIRGKMAQVWGEYEFLRDGKFDHCGVDSVAVFKTADGWKIAAITYTSETTGCKGH
jgi:hypothetical protein